MNAAYRWVQRNTDKPHRCPECHAVCGYDDAYRAWGPRKKLRCDDCAVQWRYGRRSHNLRPHLAGRRLLRLAWMGWDYPR